MTISRTDLVTQVARSAELTTAEAQRAIIAAFGAIANGLIQRTEIRIPGFGSFKTAHRAAGDRRNPATGQPIKVAAKDVARFVPAKALKDALNPPPSVPRRQSA